MKECWLCGRNGTADPLDRHHVFGSANKKKSERYGCLVDLCHNRCHLYGDYAVHKNAETMLMLHRHFQRKVMKEQNMTEDEFREEFGKSYI
ncbi:MAG: hypothetical protein IJ043_03200 [Clostridia bacterium]|nr:hypothetical protein [Clostridia bacterium]